MNIKVRKNLFLVIALLVSVCVNGLESRDQKMKRWTSKSSCGNIVDKTSKFVPMLHLIVRPDDYNCSLIRTRGFLYFKNMRDTILFSEPSKQHFDLVEYSIVLPSSARHGLNFNGHEVFVTGLFVKYDSNLSEPSPTGYFFEAMHVEKGMLYDKEVNIKTPK